MEVEFKIVSHASADWKNAVKLREVILRKPLGTYFTKEELEEEKNHIQVVGIVNYEIIATSVLVPEQTKIKMQRVVVSVQHRNQAIGTKMMQFCETYCKDRSYQMVYCHARDSAVNFYLKNGYIGEGEYFAEDGIPHLKMTKQIADFTIND